MTLSDEIREVVESASAPIALDELSAIESGEMMTRRRRLAPLMAVTVAVAGVVVLVVAMAVRTEQSATNSADVSVPTTVAFVPPTTSVPAPIVPPAPVAPMGDEYPIARVAGVDFGGVSLGTGDLIIDGRSVMVWRTADATVYRLRTPIVTGDRIWDGICSGELAFEDAAVADVAPGAGGASAACSPAWVAGVMPLTGGGWVQPDGGDGYGVWEWANVPASTDFVQISADGIERWQRPVDGMVAFPATREDMSLVVNAIAYRADGAVLATANATTMEQGSVAKHAADPSRPIDPSLPTKVVDGVEPSALTAFDSCLTTAGTEITTATRGGAPSAQLPVGDAGDTIWSGCIETAQSSLDAYLRAHPSDHTGTSGAANTDSQTMASLATLDAQALGVPGISASEIASSAPTTAADTNGKAIVNAVNATGQNVSLNETATRTTATGDTVQWAYLADTPDRRLFVVIGPTDLLTNTPALLASISHDGDNYDWPSAPDATTTAIITDSHSVIIRSEAVEPRGPTRSLDDLHSLLVAVAQSLADPRPSNSSTSTG
ncbi:MAG: hypothetical protein JWR83_590 [Aeromicrobium sp.]|nr:hypothetical protein [Aeromicrobium sp.]